jgi:hypothetical protein
MRDAEDRFPPGAYSQQLQKKKNHRGILIFLSLSPLLGEVEEILRILRIPRFSFGFAMMVLRRIGKERRTIPRIPRKTQLDPKGIGKACPRLETFSDTFYY